MLENEVKAKLQKIFGFQKATYDLPGESQEQECLFITISQPKVRPIDGRFVGQVEGSALVFAQNDKMPSGYFAKSIEKASAEDTEDFFFSDVGATQKIYQNIVQRSFSFVYFFNSQYDPDKGSIEEITFIQE